MLMLQDNFGDDEKLASHLEFCWIPLSSILSFNLSHFSVLSHAKYPIANEKFVWHDATTSGSRKRPTTPTVQHATFSCVSTTTNASVNIPAAYGTASNATVAGAPPPMQYPHQYGGARYQNFGRSHNRCDCNRGRGSAIAG